jgi:hypothetical protein
MPTFTVAGRPVTLERDTVEQAVGDVLPELVQEHYVVIRGRRYPPKQVLASVTGLDLADFTTDQARRILKQLGFVVARASSAAYPVETPTSEGPHGGRQAAALAPHVGRWVALAGPTEILVAAATPQEVLAWLAKHEQRAAYGMFRVPETVRESEGNAPL